MEASNCNKNLYFIIKKVLRRNFFPVNLSNLNLIKLTYRWLQFKVFYLTQFMTTHEKFNLFKFNLKLLYFMIN